MLRGHTSIGAVLGLVAVLLFAAPAHAHNITWIGDQNTPLEVIYEVIRVEGATASIPVSRDAIHCVSDGEASVDYETSDGSAVEGDDYESVAGALVLPSRCPYREISIKMLQDPVVEPVESFRFDLLRPKGTQLRQPRQARIVILDEVLTFAGSTPGVAEVQIGLIDDREVEGTESFKVKLAEATGAGIDVISEATVMILDDDDTIPPVTRFHLPQLNKTYTPMRFYNTGFHVYPVDNGGSGVATLKFALRQKRSAQECKWWTGSRFRNGRCGKPVWIDLRPSTFEVYYIPKALKPSKGNPKIRAYHAYARAFDHAGNRESITNKRNKVRFHVKRKK